MTTLTTDSLETLIATLLCADASDGPDRIEYQGSGPSPMRVEYDYDVRLPEKSYTCLDDEREFSAVHTDLLRPPQEFIENGSIEVALFDERWGLKWMCFRPLRKKPRNLWVATSGASLYEAHLRHVPFHGPGTYARGIAAFSKTGAPVPVVTSGSRGDGGKKSNTSLILACSIIEDAHRSNALTATVTDHVSIILPVPIGEHKEIFSIRDAPLTPGGRRKAIVHWVASHLRAKKTGGFSDVSAHWRGVREFSVDGLSVRLDSN